MNDAAIASALHAARARLGARDVAGARAALAPLLARHGSRPDVLHLQGLIERDGGDFAAAAATLAHAVKLSGGSAEIRNSLGNVLESMGRLEEADREFAAAIEAQPSYLPAWINRGRVASTRGAHELAIDTLERACRIDPRSSLALVTLGNACRRAGRHAEAVEPLRRAAQLDPAKAPPRLGLGLALRALGRPQEAIAEYEAAERAGAKAPQLLESRAAAWAEIGDLERARTDLERLTAQHPGYLPGHRTRARLFWEWALEGDPFESYRRTAEAFPREAAIWNAWIDALLSFRQYPQAVEVTGRAQAALGASPGIAAAQAIAQSEIGALAEATKLFEACLPALSGAAPFLNAFARHLLKSADPARAAGTAEGALRHDPDNQVAWAYLGTAWRLTGDARELWLHDYDRHVARIATTPPDGSQSAEAFARETAEILRSLHRTSVHPADQTLRGGTQTPGALFDRPEPEIRRIRETVEHAARAFVAGLPDDAAHPLLRRKSQEIAFSGSWSVRLTSHGFHVNHVHERGWISSAYYFALPPRDESEPEHAGWLQLGAPPEELGLGLAPRRIVEPAVGTLVLFPSSMWHGTVPFASEGERLTAAFDIVPAG